MRTVYSLADPRHDIGAAINVTLHNEVLAVAPGEGPELAELPSLLLPGPARPGCAYQQLLLIQCTGAHCVAADIEFDGVQLTVPAGCVLIESGIALPTWPAPMPPVKVSTLSRGGLVTIRRGYASVPA